MDRDTSLIVLGIAALSTVAGLIGDWARRRSPLAAHALMPWHALLFIGLTGLVFMGIHLLSLGG